MATRLPKQADEPKAQDAPKFVLLKNHGLTIDGRTSKFYEAGTEFDPSIDNAVIAALVQSGAQIEQK